MAMAIPLIPHIRFQEAFTILQRIADNICDNHPAVLRFMSYIRNIWLDISTKVSVYNCPVRTNNFVESFHNTASKHFGRHTSIWIFIDNLKKLIITQQIDFGRAKNNLQVRRSNLKISKKRNDFILQKQEDLRQNRIALTEFLKSFHQFTETQQYLIDATSSSVMHNNEVDDICGDLLSELSIQHDKEFNKSDNTDSSNTHKNTHRRPRRRRTRFPPENSTSVETGSEGDHNPTIRETSMPESEGMPTKVTECHLHDVAENILIVPEDDNGFWNMTNDLDNIV
ncbi:uncharacterized protein [Linepithema humile]|uniref:uncharacterized protein n=1 Tax=Linepithema humile TaxID=83485 RepID=UPI00351E02A0